MIHREMWAKFQLNEPVFLEVWLSAFMLMNFLAVPVSFLRTGGQPRVCDKIRSASKMIVNRSWNNLHTIVQLLKYYIRFKRRSSATKSYSLQSKLFVCLYVHILCISCVSKLPIRLRSNLAHILCTCSGRIVTEWNGTTPTVSASVRETRFSPVLRW